MSTRFSMASNMGATSISLFMDGDDDHGLPDFSPYDKVAMVPQVDRIQSTAVTNELLQDEDYQAQASKDKSAGRFSLFREQQALLKTRQFTSEHALDEGDEPLSPDFEATSPLSRNHSSSPRFQYNNISPRSSLDPLQKRRSNRLNSPLSNTPQSRGSHTSFGNGSNSPGLSTAQLIETQSSGYNLRNLLNGNNSVNSMLSPRSMNGGGVPTRMPSITEQMSMEEIARTAMFEKDYEVDQGLNNHNHRNSNRMSGTVYLQQNEQNEQHQNQNHHHSPDEMSTVSKQTTDFDVIPVDEVRNSMTRRSLNLSNGIGGSNNSNQLPRHQPVDTNTYKSEELELNQYKSDTDTDRENELNELDHEEPDCLLNDNENENRHHIGSRIDHSVIRDDSHHSALEMTQPDMDASSQIALSISPPPPKMPSPNSAVSRSQKLQNLSNLGISIPSISKMEASISADHFEQIQHQVNQLTKVQREMKSMMLSLEKTGKMTPSVRSNNSVHHSWKEPSQDSSSNWGTEGAAPGQRKTISNLSSVSASNQLTHNLPSISLSRSVATSCKYDISFLVAQPLLHNTGAEWRPVETLDSDQEEKAIKDAFQTAGRPINYIREFATVNNLRRLVTAGTHIIHYGGHGIRNALIFESDTDIGKSAKLPATLLKGLISAGKNKRSHRTSEIDRNLKLVFISACHSEDAGKAFMHAGAKHVVCVRKSQEMHDIAAGTFTFQFYFALVSGKTVQQSFEIAKGTINAEFGDNSYLRSEANKFLLLPKKADHEEVLFPPDQRNMGLSIPINNEAVHLDKAQNGASTNDDWKFHDDPSDDNLNRQPMQNTCFVNHTTDRGKKYFNPPPKASEWVGRYREMHDLMYDLMQDDLVILWGSKGLGKTAMVLRTLHYLWDRHLMAGIYHFDIYAKLKKEPSWSIAKIVAKEMMPELCRGSKMVTNEAFAEALQKRGDDVKDRKFLLVFEDIDLFEYQHLTEKQRIDIFIEEVVLQCDNIKLLVTMATKVEGTFLAKLDKRVLPQLKPLTKEEAQRLLEVLLMRDFSSNTITNKIPLKRMMEWCHQIPHLIKFTATELKKKKEQIQENQQNSNLWKMIKEQIDDEIDKLRNERYWKELNLEKGSLAIGQIRRYIRERSGQRLWEEMYSYKSRGVLETFLWRMREWYREHVDDAQFKMRPLWTYHELEFIQMELLPFLAEQTKSSFKAPKEVVRRLETMEEDVDDDEMWIQNGKHKKSKNKKSKNGKKKKQKWYTKVLKKEKSKSKKNVMKYNSKGTLMEEEDVPEVEKIPIEVFGEFYPYWCELWKTMRDPKLSPFYFNKDRDICLITGMMTRKRAKKIISGYARGTFLIRFSKRDASSLVLVVSNGVDYQPSEYKIRIMQSSHEVTFEYDTVRKGVQSAETLGQVIKEIHCVEHLWYRKRGNQTDDYVERDKRKVLKLFRDAKHGRDHLF